MNGEGYYDPTADRAIRITSGENHTSRRVYRIFLTVRNMVELAGFKITRLEFRDKNGVVHFWRENGVK